VELWDSAVLQARLWRTSFDLGATDVERFHAINTLSQAGDAALPCLRFHLMRQSTPRVQFAAAVALHRLNVPEGMATLLRALQNRLDASADIAPLLEEAFLAVGSPTATVALQSLWPGLAEWRSDAPVPPDAGNRVQLICRIWAGLQDPIALDTLIAYSTWIPALFPPTVAAFGQMAVRKLRDAARSADPFQRLLVVRTLERIPGEPSFQALKPMLRDPDPAVRFETCRALTQVGTPQANSDAVARAIQAGYSTDAAVHLLATTGHPQIYDILLLLVERAASLYHTTHDTPAAIHAALNLLMQTPTPAERRLEIVCALLEKPVPREVVLIGITHIEALRGSCVGYEARTQGVLWNLLTDLAPEVRARAAQVLTLWGEPNGKRFLELLAECRPQGSLLEKLTTLLRGGPDATQAASQAVQQVQQWVTRVSREAVVRLSSPSLSKEANQAPIRQDPRVPALTRRLLSNALRYLASAQAVEETEEALALSITAVRALRRLGIPDALIAQAELLRAFRTQKQLLSNEAHPGFLHPAPREIAEPVREEAALALIEFLGPESFGIFVEALGAPGPEIQGTAILALGRLGDARAVPYLQPIAGNPDNMLAPHAIQALAVIRQNNPEMMTLLRGSSLADSQTDTLLRPLPHARPDSAPELLLRPTSNGEASS
jgi:HEAT repeat protein